MKRINQTKLWITSHPYHSGVGALLIIVIAAFLLSQGGGEDTGPIEEAVRQVKTTPVSEYSAGALGVAVPTASGNSFVVRSEANGRVNRSIKPNTKVQQGAIIAELDNATERASLTQAQGTYEAALAGAAQSDVGVVDAKTGLTATKQAAISADREAMSAWNSVLYNTVDEFFINPRISPPGVRISAEGRAAELNSDRVALNTVLTDWQREVDSLSSTANTASLIPFLDRAIGRVDLLTEMVDTFIELVPKQKTDEIFTAAEISRLSGELSSARASLNSSRLALESAKSALQRAEEGVSSAEIGGTSSRVSAANASIKQALGVYQAAKANYDRTIVRAPFNGTVTSLNVAVGDIIGVGTDISIIIPEEGVETTRWWSLPLSAVKYTPDNAFVFTVDGEGKVVATVVETGLVSANNIKVTGLQGNESIIEDVRGLKSGDKVAVEN